MMEAASGERVLRFQPSGGAVLSMAFSPDGKRLVSGHQNSVAFIWSLEPQGTHRLWRPDDPDSVWEAFVGKDAAAAFQAMPLLQASAEETLERIRRDVEPLSEETLRLWVRRLDSERSADRIAAASDLKQARLKAIPLLRKLEEPRMKEILGKLETFSADLIPRAVRHLRLVRLLERIGTPAAREILPTMGTGVDDR